MTEKLYPPIIEGALPAFTKESITIPYDINRGVAFSNVLGFALIIKSTITNKIILKDEILHVTTGKVTFNISNKEIKPGQFYKIQLAFIGESGVGYYSDVGVAKCTCVPTVTIEEDSSAGSGYIGTYTNEDITEKMYSYTFSLFDNEGNLIETSGEMLHNATKDVGKVQYNTWIPKIGMDNGSNYIIKFSVTTMNNYTITDTKTLSSRKDELGFVPRGIRLNAIADNNEEGCVHISVSSTLQNNTRELIYGKFRIFKTSSKDNFKSKYLVAYFSLENQDLFEQTFKDYTVESGYSYRYILQQRNDYGIYSEEIFSPIVEVHFEHMYLFDGKKQLKIKFNPKVSTFKNNILETKIETIGSKYPFFLRNGSINYKEINISGLISYHMDEQNSFCTDEEIWNCLKVENVSGKEEWTHNLTDRSIAAEKEFKLKVLEWLQNGEIKMFRSPTEGNYLVRLMNVSLTPNDTVGRMLHTFSATGYEIQDINEHSFAQALTIIKNNKYIGYRTIPLYDFPFYKIAAPVNGNYTVINDNRIYEIIGNPNQEYVVAARFEDVKPGTKFSIILERGLELENITIEIGATGFYRIPRELGFHIKSIKLISKDWQTGDFSSDIINNRGQVTYEYERQADHNNFNDITKIQSEVAISSPWYPTWYNVVIDEPVVSNDKKNIFSYNKAGTTTAYVEVAWFEGKERPFIYGIDYIKEEDSQGTIHYYAFYKDGKKRIKKGKEELILLENEKGCVYEKGDYIYSFKPSEILTSESINNGIVQHEPGVKFGYDQQEINLVNTYTYYYQVYGDYIKNQYYLNPEDEDHIYYSTGYTDFSKNGFYYSIPFEKDNNNAFAFILETNSQGHKIISETVQKDYYIENPYYTKLEYIDKETRNEQLVSIYKLEQITASKFLNKDDINNGDNKTLEQDVIYKNYIPNKFYNFTNINGDYYCKEDISNIYSINFELIQVFYEENLEKSKQNIPCLGLVKYDDEHENNSIEDVDNKKSSTYQCTNRIISGSSYKRGSDNNIILQNEETYMDNILVNNYSIDYRVLCLNEYNEDVHKPIIKEIYGIEPTRDNSGKVDWSNFKDFLFVYEKNSNNEWKYLKKLELKEEEELDYTKIQDYYLNIYAQATKNYTQLTKPQDNEVIIVMTDNLSNPIRIDLSQRFSYELQLDNNYSFDNIEAIYLGKNVRGFATYKRKLYEYRALVADGTYVDLTLEKEGE